MYVSDCAPPFKISGSAPAIVAILTPYCKTSSYQLMIHSRDDYNSLTSDIFQVILLNVRPLVHYLSNDMYGCPIKLRDNMAINGLFLKPYNHLCIAI